MTKQLNRRIFLRGLGGAVVAAPFLGSIADRGAKAQAAGAPKRMIAMFTHNGCVTTRFWPSKSHGPLAAADLTSTSLAPLSPFVSKLLIPRGIRAMNEWTSNMTRGQGNDPHLQAVASYFTCQPVTPNSDDPFSFNQATKFNAKPVGPSLDHVMAQQLSSGGTPLFLRVSGLNDSPQSAISYSAAETIFPGMSQPAQAFSELTGLFKDGPVSPDTYAAVKGKSVLDLVKDDLDTLERFDMSQSDRTKLDAWKELLDATGTGMVTAQCRQDVAAALEATQANVDAVAAPPSTTTDRLTTMITDTLDGADISSNVAVLAAVCNVNPVIFLKYPFAYVYRGLGVNVDGTSLAHRVGSASTSGACLTGVIDMLLKVDSYHARKFAHLVKMLDSVQEDDGTVLDNTAAIWFQDMSDGSAHNLNNLPIVQAGSAGGYFKTGWTVNVEDGSADLSNGNSEASCVPGTPSTVDGNSTGTDPKLANAPINKYFCNLMNALGVKAGTDGFPARGGAEEVIHYGRYDRTEDFVGGTVNPPMIHSPGGFDSLRGVS